MISKFDNDLRNEYYRSQEMLINKKITPDGVEALLLAICQKDDSLINCLGQIKIEDMLKTFEKYHLDYKKESIKKAQEIITLAYEISVKDKETHIGDEHILYALINISFDYLNIIYDSMKISIKDIKISVDDYFEFDEDDYLVDLTCLGKLDKFNPFIGRKEYINKIIRILSKKQKNNCILIGSAGVGKSALVEGVVMTLLKQEKFPTVYRLELGVIIAGTRYRGDLEERLCDVIKKVKKEKAILFIDEIHNIVGGTKGEDAINIANILKPILARSEIKCIGATTLEEYYDYIDKDKALARRFQTLFIPEATEEETLKILKKIKYKYEDFYHITYNDDIIKAIIKACIYLPNRKYPDKAIDILDELGAYVTSMGAKKPLIKNIKKIVFENIGLRTYEYRESFLNDLRYPQIMIYYNRFINKMENNFQYNNIMNLHYLGTNDELIIKDINKIFNLQKEAIIKIDFDLFDEHSYNYVINSVLKFPIVCIVCYEYELNKCNYYNIKIQKILERGIVYDQNGRIISFQNVIFIMVDSDNKKSIGFKTSFNSDDGKYDLVIYESNLEKYKS